MQSYYVAFRTKQLHFYKTIFILYLCLYGRKHEIKKMLEHEQSIKFIFHNQPTNL